MDTSAKMFEQLLEGFTAYSRMFTTGNDPALHDAVSLKYAHTLRVIDEIQALTQSVNGEASVCFLAKIAALFHDIGRFEQFKTYRTFSDDKSENHAALSIVILTNNNFLRDIDHSNKEMILSAIHYHNAIEVPRSLNARHAFLCRLLRDADKLDIFQLAINYYQKPDIVRKNILQTDIPENSTVSSDICDYVLERKVVPYSMVKTIADFKILQLGWIVDLNFIHSLKCVKERGVIAGIRQFLPDSPKVASVVAKVEQFLEEKISSLEAGIRT